jgi:RHS repeat-associated protein
MLSISKPSTHFLHRFVAWLHVLVLFAFMAANASAQTKVTYFHNDLSGNPVAASNSTGQIIWRESYRPYGERLKNEAASQTNSQWYTGHRQDADTGLVYMGARHYDPSMGRFLSIDPAGFNESDPHSFNRYAYANNNPMKFVDPDGRHPLAIATIARIAFGGAAAVSVGSMTLSPDAQARIRQDVSDGFRSGADALGGFITTLMEGGKTPTVQENKADGDRARDEVASDLQAAGRGVEKEVREKTPFGGRIIDIEVSDENGKILGGVEVKKGGSRYRADQRSKDEYLRGQDYPVDLVRKP